MSPLGGIYRSTRLGGQGTSPRDKEGYHGITSILNYHIWSCLIYSNKNTNPWVKLADYYTVSNARPVNLPKAATVGCCRLKPAWNQARISSPTQAKTLSTMRTRRSNVLPFLSFQSSQQVKTTRVSKHYRSSFLVFFLTLLLQTTSLHCWGSGKIASQPSLRSNLNQTSLENGMSDKYLGSLAQDRTTKLDVE